MIQSYLYLSKKVKSVTSHRNSNMVKGLILGIGEVLSSMIVEVATKL